LPIAVRTELTITASRICGIAHLARLLWIIYILDDLMCTGASNGVLAKKARGHRKSAAPWFEKQAYLSSPAETGELRALAILFVELQMAVVEAGELALDEQVFHFRVQLKQIAIRYD